MDTRHNSSDKQRYSDAGEQAARLIGDFMSMANEFSKKFDQGTGVRATQSGGAERGDVKPEKAQNENRFQTDQRQTAAQQTGEPRTSESPQLDEEWQKAGDYLRELREAAGYTIDGFASALNRKDATKTVEAAEAGREVFPKDWFDQAIAVLKHRDPLEFFNKLQDCYQPSAQSSDGGSEQSTTPDTQTLRSQKLSSIFSDETALEELTDTQFEELRGFMQSNYQAALRLVSKKLS